MPRNEYDVLIIGGGMVGASLACALGELPLEVALVESVPFGSADQPSYDERTTALALGTRRIYEALGLWPAIAEAAEPIRQIHVSEQGRFGTTQMDAAEQSAEALGYVVANRVLGRVLNARLRELPRLRTICPAKFMALESGSDAVSVRVETEGVETGLRAKLVVGADGANSAVRAALGIGTEVREYAQTAIVTVVTPERHHGGVAYERFAAGGPIALLPMSEARCALVWTQPTDKVEALLGASDAEFLVQLNEAFGHRLGDIQRVGKRLSYPLRRVMSERLHAPRALLIGNAAHSLHPVAGQGFNLGLRDAALLAEVLAEETVNTPGDPGSDSVIERYLAGRREDQTHVSRFTDGLVRIFSNRLPGLASLRHLGIIGLDLLPPVKARFARRSMGMVGAPRLSRGLPLVNK